MDFFLQTCTGGGFPYRYISGEERVVFCGVYVGAFRRTLEETVFIAPPWDWVW